MKKFFTNLLCVAMMATCVFTLFSCGNDGDDDVTDGGGSSTEEKHAMGVYKVVFSVSGAHDKFTWIATANGLTMTNGTQHLATIYDENGAECKQISNVTSKTFMTEKNGTRLSVSFVVTALKSDKGVDNLTVTLEGYVNDKKVDSKTYEFDNSKNMSETYSFTI